jgi:hypothetical protein
MSALLEPCHVCVEARAALLALYNAVSRHPLVILGVPLSPHWTQDPVELSARELTIRCSKCKDTRFLFTEEGKLLLSMIVKGVDDSSVEAFLVKESTV